MSVLICLICDFKANSEDVYKGHMYCHKYKLNSSFKCYQCSLILTNYNSFISHLKRNHHSLKNPSKILVEKIFRCKEAYCNYESVSRSDIFSHLQIHFNLNQNISCPYENCNKTFKFKNSFHVHLFRNHKSEPPSCEKIPEKKSEFVDLTSNVLDISFSECPGPSSDIITEPSTLTILFLNLLCKHSVPDIIIQNIFDEFKKSIDVYSNNVKDEIIKFCEINQLQHIQEDLLGILNINDRGLDISELNSKHNRLKSFKKHFGLVEPIEIFLGKDKFGKCQVYHYIPILETLKSLLAERSVLQQFIDGNKDENLDENNFNDYISGSVYKNNPFFATSDKKLEIILYQDAFEVCNPLGSAKGKHKILGVYMVLGNLKPYNRSKIDNINLVALCKNKFVSEYGMNKILEVLTEDLMKLETIGIPVKFNDQHIIYIKGSLVFVTGDNLGAHQLGGFVENFSLAEYLCRFCLFTRKDLKSGSLELQTLRSIENYNADVLNVPTVGIKLNYNGIKNNSVLNNLAYFHICNPGLPPCVAHDLFEGCFSEDMILVVKYFVNIGVFDYENLNLFLNKIPKILRYNIRFPTITKDMNKIPGCAYENLYFIIVFPLFMLTHSFDMESNAWILFISILEIVRLVCSLKISEDEILYLTHAIKEFIEYRKVVFPDNPFKPKHHYVYHYPSLIRQFGPLSKLWTLRFENKHQFFKRVANRCKNHRNITKTLATRHQLHQASLINDRFPPEISCNKACEFDQSMFNIALPIKCLFISKSIEIRGISYQADDCIVAQINKHVDITVLKIDAIFLDKNYENVIFYGKYIKMWYNYKNGLFQSSSKFINNQNMMCFYSDLKTLITFRLFSHENNFFLSPSQNIPLF